MTKPTYHLRGPKGFFWDALSCWCIGHTAGFFNAINGYRAYSPTPWDYNLWIEHMRMFLGYSAG